MSKALAAAAANTALRVTVRRGETKTVLPRSVPARRRSAPSCAPTLSLEDYLERRSGGER